MRAVQTVVYATLIVALTAPVVRAQSFNIIGADAMHLKTQDEVDQENQRNNDYKSSLNKMPDQNVKKDPWGNIRGGQSDQKPAGQKPKQANQKPANQKQADQKPKQTNTQ